MQNFSYLYEQETQVTAVRHTYTDTEPGLSRQRNQAGVKEEGGHVGIRQKARNIHCALFNYFDTDYDKITSRI